MISLLDVSIGSDNAGDHIITDAVLSELRAHDSRSWRRVPTHVRPTMRQAKDLWRSSIIVAGGSNLLASHMERHRQWLVTPDLVALLRGKVILCGVGWWQYQGRPCLPSRLLLRTLLNRNAIHSVRDSYTKHKLEELGFHVTNTGCPTMWSLGDFRVPRAAGATLRTAIVTLTDYNRNPARDELFLRLVCDRFHAVRFVAMAQPDIQYFNSLKVPNKVQVAGHGTATLNAEVSKEGVCFVGTRLHAGVRAMQLGTPAIILAVDNRALEISRDTSLPILLPEQLGRETLNASLAALSTANIEINRDAIASWRESLSLQLRAAKSGFRAA